MELTKQDELILKALVEKELKDVEKEGKIMISNSPFLNKIGLDDPDLPFMKSVDLYKEYLKELLNKF